jgi:hypothetical protein
MDRLYAREQTPSPVRIPSSRKVEKTEMSTDGRRHPEIKVRFQGVTFVNTKTTAVEVIL